jgi:hypothetical protein
MSGHDSISIPGSIPIFESIEPVIHADVETHKEIPEEDNNTVARNSKRQRAAKFFGEDFIIYLMDDTPITIVEAYSSFDADLWKEVVQSEMDSILSNGT